MTKNARIEHGVRVEEKTVVCSECHTDFHPPLGVIGNSEGYLCYPCFKLALASLRK